MAVPIRVNTPIVAQAVEKLRAGDKVLLSGTIYVARDAAHERLVHELERGKTPFDLQGQTIYYMGPSPAPPGRVIGSAGPTTSSRMDGFTPRLLAAGLRAMIGKGKRSAEVKEAIKRHKAVYFAAVGGVAALLSKCITQSEVVAYPDLGPEAILRISVTDFPVIVVNDVLGGDLLEQGKAKYQRGK